MYIYYNALYEKENICFMCKHGYKEMGLSIKSLGIPDLKRFGQIFVHLFIFKRASPVRRTNLRLQF